jgi:hypothetical protein
MLVGASPFFLYPDAGGYAESGCDSGQYRDKDVEDFTPNVFVCVHSLVLSCFHLFILPPPRRSLPVLPWCT